jgi:hypothetical protein
VLFGQLRGLAGGLAAKPPKKLMAKNGVDQE